MIKEILYKIFKVDDICPSCETLKQQLEISNAERRYLLDKLLQEDIITQHVPNLDEVQPIMPKVIPWHIKREILEKADRKEAEAIKAREAEIAKNRIANSPKIEALEKELLDEVPIDNSIDTAS